MEKILKNLMFLLALCFSMSLNLVASTRASAYSLIEVEPGILEIRGTQKGTLMGQMHVDKSKHWIYVEVREGADSRYFYAPFKDFAKDFSRDFTKISGHKKLQSIQYGVGHRIFNTKGKVPFGSQKYFYPLVDYRAASL